MSERRMGGMRFLVALVAAAALCLAIGLPAAAGWTDPAAPQPASRPASQSAAAASRRDAPAEENSDRAVAPASRPAVAPVKPAALPSLAEGLLAGPKTWTSPEGLGSTLAGRGSFDRVEPGAGGAVDDHLLRADRRRARPVAPGAGRSEPPAHAGHHHAGDVSHAAGDDAGLEADRTTKPSCPTPGTRSAPSRPGPPAWRRSGSS